MCTILYCFSILSTYVWAGHILCIIHCLLVVYDMISSHTLIRALENSISFSLNTHKKKRNKNTIWSSSNSNEFGVGIHFLDWHNFWILLNDRLLVEVLFSVYAFVIVACFTMMGSIADSFFLLRNQANRFFSLAKCSIKFLNI